jgi:hypothetical protein
LIQRISSPLPIFTALSFSPVVERTRPVLSDRGLNSGSPEILISPDGSKTHQDIYFRLQSQVSQSHDKEFTVFWIIT